MAGRDDLIQGFSRLVMQEASSKRQSILEDIRKSESELLEEKERLFLEQAYLKVQDAVKETKKIRNEDYSKAVLESKKNLLIQRANIMNEVFNNVEKRFLEFRNSKKYIEWIEKLIIEGTNKINANDYIVRCEVQDKKIIKMVLDKLNIKAQIIDNLEETQGGIIIESKEKSLLINLTIKEMLKEARTDFLSYSKLCVNRW